VDASTRLGVSGGEQWEDSPAAQLPACQYGVLSKLDAIAAIIIYLQ